MHLDVTYTADDLREALTPAPDQRRKNALPLVIISIAVLLLLMLFTIVYVVLEASRAGAPQSTFSFFHPPQDLLITLLPSLSPALIIPMMLAIILIRATRGGASKRARFFIALLLCGIIILLLVPLWLLLKTDIDLIWHPSRTQLVLLAFAPWILSLALCVTLLLIWRQRAIKAQWSSNPSFHRPRQIDLIPDHGLHIRDDVLEYRLTWKFFQSARETPNLLLLVGEDRRVYMLPKRCFTSQEDLAAAKALIREHVARARFLPGDAFPVLPTQAESRNA